MLTPTLEPPQIARQGAHYGVKLKASAPSLHVIRADLQTEVNPIVGTQKQSEDLAAYLKAAFESDREGIWQTEIFGKTLYDLVRDGMSGKLAHLPEDARQKLRQALERIINEGSGGMICILL